MTAYLVGAARPPIGGFGGALASLSAPELGAAALRAAIERAGVSPATVEQVIMGNVIAAGLGQAPARQAGIGAGLPPAHGALTVNKVCGSGLMAVMLAAQAIRLGEAHVIAAGGMESMSRAPYLLPQARQGQRLGHGRVVDAMILDGLWDPYHDFHMGSAAERTARALAIGREAQDRFAAESYRRAQASIAEGRFRAEIVPVTATGGRGPATVDTDEEPSRIDFDRLPGLRPAFEAGGTITAANASTIADGAAALVVASEEAVRRHGLAPRARIIASAVAGRAPEDFPVAPIDAVRKVLAAAQLTAADVDLFEVNEAFAVVVLAAIGELGLDPARVNVNGGAIALGHPVGSTGARLVTTALHELERTDGTVALVTMCCGGGLGTGTIIERR